MNNCERPLPWSNVYGLARTLFATATLLTLLVNEPGSLWIAAAGIPDAPMCGGAGVVPSLFCISPQYLNIARWVAIAALAVVASGWRPRFTGVLHWWISQSLISSALLCDGGDQLAASMTLLMVPLTLLDGRRSHWDAAPRSPGGAMANLRAGLGVTTLWMLRLQVAVVYLNAAAAKWGETQWADGTALYYWFVDPSFGFTAPLQAVFGPLMHNAFVVSTMTWGVVVFEFALFGGLFLSKRRPRMGLLILGVMFHTGIAIVHGLPSFVIIMFGALIILLRREYEPFERPVSLQRVAAMIGRKGRIDAGPTLGLVTGR